MKIEFETIPVIPRLVIVRVESYWPHHKMNHKNAFDHWGQGYRAHSRELIRSIKFPAVFRGRDIAFIKTGNTYDKASDILLELERFSLEPADFLAF